MSELPDELRALLDLTRDAHDPIDPEARHRVRHAVAASLLLGGAGTTSLFPQAAASNTQTLAAGGASKSWLLFGSKLGTLAAGTIAAAGLTLAAYSFTRPEAPRTRAPMQQVEAQPVAAPAQRTPVDVPAAAVVQPVQAEPSEPAPVRSKVSPAHRSQPSAETLSLETGLLRSASEALARGDELGAIGQLKQHAARFPAGSLREERDGLRAIAECTRDDAPSTAAARRFLRSHPGSLLGARVTKACAVE